MRQQAPSHMDNKPPLDKVSSPLEDLRLKQPFCEKLISWIHKLMLR